MMKQKRLVSMIGLLAVLVSAVFMMTGCPDKLPEIAEYTKDEFALTFKNESGKVCYVEISGCSKNLTPFITPGWISSLSFPTVLKTEIPIGGEKTITVKDVVVSGKTSKEIRIYKPEFRIHVIPDDSMYYNNRQTFISESKSQYTGGIFHIKLQGKTFKVDYTN